MHINVNADGCILMRLTPNPRVCGPAAGRLQRSAVIDAALNFIADQANSHLRKRMASDLGEISVGPLVDDRGSWVVPQDRLRLALFQIDEERTLREQLPERRLIGGREVLLPPPLLLNLVVVFAGRFQQYDQALRTLSHLLAFFQARPLFTPSDSPALPAGSERLALDLLSWGPEQLNQMWACLGAKHLPSLIYRVRLIVLQDLEPVGTGAPITTIDTVLHGR